MVYIVIGDATLCRPIDDGPGKGPTVVDAWRATFPDHRGLRFPLCLRHGREIGTIDRHDYNGDLMRVHATVTDETVGSMIDQGELTGLSIGFTVLKSQQVRSGGVYFANGKQRVATCDLTLVIPFIGEVSVVPEPADPACRIYSVKRLADDRKPATGFVPQSEPSAVPSRSATYHPAPIPVGPGGQLLLTTR